MVSPYTEHKYIRMFMINARIDVVGASDAGIRIALYDLLAHFFEFTGIWQEQIAFTTAPDVQEYTFVPGGTPPGQIIRLQYVIDQNNIVQPASLPIMDPVTVRLRDTPNTAWDGTACFAKSVVIGDDCEVPEIPDWIWQRWMPVIMHGVMGKMMLTPSKSYTDAKAGTYHWRFYERDASLIRGMVLRQNTYGTNSWMYPQSWRMRGQRGGVSVGNPLGF